MLRSLALTITLMVVAPALADSLLFVQNAPSNHEYGHQLDLPATFGEGEFTLELWIRPDDGFPVGPTGGAGQLVNWSDADEEPYSSCCWWYEGNFLLDGHNNGSFADGTFSLQFYGGGRVRWLFGDGEFAGPGGHWSIGAYPADTGPDLLDGNWHQLTLVRRWEGVSSARLELWIDGVEIASEISPARTDMRVWWDDWTDFPGTQEGWFWGAEKQAAVGILSQYEDFKGLVDEIRFWDRAKTPLEIASDYALPVTGNEPGLVGWYPLDDGAGASTCDTLDGSACIALLVPQVDGFWSIDNAPLGAGPVPAASTVGLIVMGLTLAAVGLIVVHRRRIA